MPTLPASKHAFMLPENVLIFSGVIAAFHLGKVSPAIPALQASLGLSMVQAGFLLSLMQLAGALAGVLMGLLGDAIGARRSLLIGQTLLCVASLSALAAHSPYTLLALRAVESLGFLMVILPTPGLLRSLVPHERLSFRLGLWSCYIAIGTTSAFIIGPYVIEDSGWRVWWMVPAAGSLLCLWLITRAIPPSRPTQPHQAETLALPSWRARLSRILSTRSTWFVGIAFAMYSGQWMAIIGFLPTIYTDAGTSTTTAGLLTALAALVNISGNLYAAFLIHRGAKPQAILTAGYLLLFTMAAIAFSNLTQDLPTLRYIAILLFSALGGMIPATLFVLAVRSAPDHTMVAAAVGWVQQLSSLGTLLMPPFLAQLAGWAGGWHFTWVATGIAAGIGLILSVAVARR